MQTTLGETRVVTMAMMATRRTLGCGPIPAQWVLPHNKERSGHALLSRRKTAAQLPLFYDRSPCAKKPVPLYLPGRGEGVKADHML